MFNQKLLVFAFVLLNAISVVALCNDGDIIHRTKEVTPSADPSLYVWAPHPNGLYGCWSVSDKNMVSPDFCQAAQGKWCWKTVVNSKGNKNCVLTVNDKEEHFYAFSPNMLRWDRRNIDMDNGEHFPEAPCVGQKLNEMVCYKPLLSYVTFVDSTSQSLASGEEQIRWVRLTNKK